MRLRRTVTVLGLVGVFVLLGAWLRPDPGAPAPAAGASASRSASPSTGPSSSPAGSATTSASPSPSPSVAPARGTGSLATVPLPAIGDTAPRGARTVRVTLQVERGSGVDAADAARRVAVTLGSPRGWQGQDAVRFVLASARAGRAGSDMRIVLASPALTDRLCAPLNTHGHTSCFNAGAAVLNARRWIEGIGFYGDDLVGYRTYMINHEVGHGLGHGHVPCPRAGATAPIMLQQTLRLDGCVRNPWPRGS